MCLGSSALTGFPIWTTSSSSLLATGEVCAVRIWRLVCGAVACQRREATPLSYRRWDMLTDLGDIEAGKRFNGIVVDDAAFVVGVGPQEPRLSSATHPTPSGQLGESTLTSGDLVKTGPADGRL